MKDICAIPLTPALGKDQFAHNFPFPQNRPPVFYIFTVVSEIDHVTVDAKGVAMRTMLVTIYLTFTVLSH